MATITTIGTIKIAEIFEGYIDRNEAGIVSWRGKLNIRPAYQREFVYDIKKRTAVLNTIQTYGARALGVLWFAENEDGTYELMDGQQRTLSFCQYLNGDFAINSKYFHNLPKDVQDVILNEELLVNVFRGTESEKLEWFKTINIAGEKLTDQELRNAAYTGPWLADAKKHFSKTGCAAYSLGQSYLTGTAIRQDYLETVLYWISTGEDKTIEEYMAEHQHDTDATALWEYFRSVINWVKTVFPKYRKEMKGLPWGCFYNRYHTSTFDPVAIEEQITALMQDEDVTNHKGIYEYVLDGNERHLNIRAFDEKQKRIGFERQHGYCPRCRRLKKSTAGHKFSTPGEMHADHMTAHKHGGATTLTNLVMLCPECNEEKSGNNEFYSEEEISEMIKEYEGV